jgi:hypothetical protein
LIINVPALIVQNPRSQIAFAGETVRLEVISSGTEPFAYRWRRNGLTISGQTNAVLTLVNVQPAQSGQYSVVVTNAGTSPGPTPLSAIATLVVYDADRDGDRTPDVWETANGFNPDDPNDADGDTDEDGMLNSEEFIAGTNPRDPESRFWVDLQISSDANFIMNSVQFPAISNRVYTVQVSPDISSTTWSNFFILQSALTNRLPAITDLQARTNRIPRRFYRVVTPFPPE